MLVPEQWYAVVESREVLTQKPVGIRRLGESLVFWRDGQGQISVMKDRCPHRSSALSLGRIVDGRIQCPFHGFEFNTEGVCELIPANGRSTTPPKVFACQNYPVQEAFGFIWVWFGKPQDQYPPLPWFPNLESMEYQTFQKTWDVDITRSIEGLLDVSHLPFVHPHTIGRGYETLVNGPYTTIEDDTIRVWIDNQPDAGVSAVKPSQLPTPSGPASLEFRFPNLWQLNLGPATKVVNVIAPVDDGKCVIYIRTYVKTWVSKHLTRLIAWVSNLFNLYVLSEDYSVIRSQTPKVSDLNIGERFIPADRPIAIYLQHRRDLIARSRGVHPVRDEPTSEPSHAGNP